MRSWNSRRLPISFMGGHGISLMFGIDFQRALLGKRSERLEANPLRFGEYDLTTARTHARCRACLGQRFYKVRPRKDRRGVNPDFRWSTNLVACGTDKSPMQSSTQSIAVDHIAL
jgi:DNA-directed RNA polymerase subunit RPC12/RpoP